jgi:hypothetical protein
MTSTTIELAQGPMKWDTPVACADREVTQG